MKTTMINTEKHITIFTEAVKDYLQKLAQIEARCQDTNSDQERILKEVTQLTDTILEECSRYETSAADPYSIIQAREWFRNQTQSLLEKSTFIRHGRTWPRGYQGDYIMLESAYRNTPSSKGIGYYLDRYSLSTTLAQAVRSRRKLLREILQRELSHRTEPRVLDIACGSCREIFELASDISRAKAQVTCLDFDSEALAFAQGRMEFSGVGEGQLLFRKYNAIKMISHDRNIKEFGMQDIVYSVGFFDYLDDNVLSELLKNLYKLVSPGGVLILSFKDIRRYSMAFYRWMMNWDGFFPRTEEEHRYVIEKAGISLDTASITRDESGVILFFVVTKP